MPGQQPDYRILTKNEGEETFSEIGALWKTSKADIFSVRLSIDGQEIKGIMVKNKPKQPVEMEPTVPAPSKKALPQRRPAA